MANSLCPASLFAPVTLDKSPCLSEIPVSPRELGNCHRMSVTGSELSVPFRLNSVWSHRAGPGWFPPTHIGNIGPMFSNLFGHKLAVFVSYGCCHKLKNV